MLKHHKDYIVAHYAPYATIQAPIAPYKGINNFYLCLCCNLYHNKMGPAKKHLTTCNAINQLEAIYTLINSRPTTTNVTIAPEVTHSDIGLTRMLKHREGLIKTHEDMINVLKSTINNLRSEKNRIESKLAYTEYNYSTQLRLEKERYNFIKDRLFEANRDDFVEADKLELDEYELSRIIDLSNQIKTDKKETLVQSPPPPPPPPPPPLQLETNSYCRGCSHKGEPEEFEYCIDCKLLYHKNDGILNCWTLECESCGKSICDNCRKATLSTKLRPRCKSCGPCE
jgi:hypothetical protein